PPPLFLFFSEWSTRRTPRPHGGHRRPPIASSNSSPSSRRGSTRSGRLNGPRPLGPRCPPSASPRRQGGQGSEGRRRRAAFYNNLLVGPEGAFSVPRAELHGRAWQATPEYTTTKGKP